MDKKMKPYLIGLGALAGAGAFMGGGIGIGIAITKETKNLSETEMVGMSKLIHTLTQKQIEDVMGMLASPTTANPLNTNVSVAAKKVIAAATGTVDKANLPTTGSCEIIKILDNGNVKYTYSHPITKGTLTISFVVDGNGKFTEIEITLHAKEAISGDALVEGGMTANSTKSFKAGSTEITALNEALKTNVALIVK